MSIDGSDDAAVVAALQAGDRAATAGFVQAHAGRMHAVARRMLGSEDEARDAVQEAFLRAFQSLHEFRGAARLGTWLHRIVVNEALMRLRARKARPELQAATEQSIDDLLPRYYEDGHRIAPRPAWAESADALLERREVRALVQRSIERLPDTLRVVLVLRDVEELDVKETAALLALSEGAVKTRLHRARQALRALLEKELVP